MLEEIIKELTITQNDDQITSGGALAWAKRVEAKRAQAAVLNIIMELRQFDKVKVVKKPKGRQHKMSIRSNSTVVLMQILWWDTCTEAVSGIWQDMCGLWQNWAFQKGVPM